jgi:hypothetical protein
MLAQAKNGHANTWDLFFNLNFIATYKIATRLHLTHDSATSDPQLGYLIHDSATSHPHTNLATSHPQTHNIIRSPEKILRKVLLWAKKVTTLTHWTAINVQYTLFRPFPSGRLVASHWNISCLTKGLPLVSAVQNISLTSISRKLVSC